MRKHLATIGVLLVGLGGGIIYTLFNPAHNIYFPKCPFRMLTGLQCPGCGSQRAIHSLLNGDLLSAWNYNQLLVVSIPYILCYWVLKTFAPRSAIFEWLRRYIYGRVAVWIWFVVIVVFAVVRNIWGIDGQ